VQLRLTPDDRNPLNRPIQHIRTNLIAYLALFVALGGSSYAAFSVPNGSVGAQQIKNHTITPVKFDPRSIRATVRYWAVVDPSGRVLASRPKARNLNSGTSGAILTWGQTFSPGCFALATVDGISLPGGEQLGFASTSISGGELVVHTFAPGGAPDAKRVNVAVLCP
jgi:hypothetical protein